MALVEVENGEPVGTHGWLIRPPVFEFWPFNVALHGITPEMCADAPEWPESLAEILAIADGSPLVAHNAAFDLGVIRDACLETELAWPELSYGCTLVVSRRIWPELSSHSLPFVATHLDVELVDHHDPVADAMATAWIGSRALAESRVDSIEDLMAQHAVLMGRLSPGDWSGCHGKDYPSARPLPTEPRPGADPDGTHPLDDVTVTFTGALAVPRREAQQQVVDCGGRVTRGVTRETELLVTGYQDLTKLAAGASKSAKLQKAEALQVGGQSIDIVGEREFVRLLAGH